MRTDSFYIHLNTNHLMDEAYQFAKSQTVYLIITYRHRWSCLRCCCKNKLQ